MNKLVYIFCFLVLLLFDSRGDTSAPGGASTGATYGRSQFLELVRSAYDLSGLSPIGSRSSKIDVPRAKALAEKARNDAERRLVKGTDGNAALDLYHCHRILSECVATIEGGASSKAHQDPADKYLSIAVAAANHEALLHSARFVVPADEKRDLFVKASYAGSVEACTDLHMAANSENDVLEAYRWAFLRFLNSFAAFVPRDQPPQFLRSWQNYRGIVERSEFADKMEELEREVLAECAAVRFPSTRR